MRPCIFCFKKYKKREVNQTMKRNWQKLSATIVMGAATLAYAVTPALAIDSTNTNDHTGANSNNTANTTVNNTQTVTNNNDASINNTINISSNSGGNTANNNTGDGSVSSGGATSNV